MFDGMINVYKEQGYTSNDVVACLRGILHQRRIGHTGTLDPDAEGVLPVCLGTGTKLCSLITDHDKVYEASMRLGMTTDTQDISGRVIARHTVEADEEAVRAALMNFVGGYAQIPPMYSAIKINGRKLYELARKGRTVERHPRPVTIYSIDHISICLPDISFTVRCSKGTYIRTLCNDVGDALGCGGVLTALKRTAVGRFTVQQSLTLGQIEELAGDEEKLLPHIISVEEMLADYPAASAADERADRLLHNGNPLNLEDVVLQGRPGGTLRDGEELRIYDASGHFTALYRYEKDRNRLRSSKMFV